MSNQEIEIELSEEMENEFEKMAERKLAKYTESIDSNHLETIKD